jgi:hypothetical protein
MALVGRDWRAVKNAYVGCHVMGSVHQARGSEGLQVGNLFLVNGIAFAGIGVDFDIDQVSFHAVLIILGAFVDGRAIVIGWICWEVFLSIVSLLDALLLTLPAFFLMKLVMELLDSASLDLDLGGITKELTLASLHFCIEVTINGSLLLSSSELTMRWWWGICYME